MWDHSCVKLWIFSYWSVLTYVLGAQKTCLIETILLSTYNICFCWELRFFSTNTLLSKGLETSLLIVSMFFQSEWKTVWILIRGLPQKPADLDLQCFQKRINPDSAGQVLMRYLGKKSEWISSFLILNSSLNMLHLRYNSQASKGWVTEK